MLNTLTITTNSNSNYQKVSLLPASAKQLITISLTNQKSDIYLSMNPRTAYFPDIRKFIDSEAFQAMLASESVLRKEWDTHEEDLAWETL